MTVPTTEENVYSLIEDAMKEANSGNTVLAEQLLMRSYGSLESQRQQCNELRSRVFHLLANSYRDSGKLKVARDFYEKARQLFQDESLVPVPLAFFDDVYIQALREDDSELALLSQLDLYKVLQNPSCQPLKLRLRNLRRLVALTWAQSKYDKAEKYLREYLDLAVDGSVVGSPEQMTMLCHLGLIEFRLGKFAEAEAVYRQALMLSENLGSASEAEQAELLSELGLALCKQGKHDEAQVGCKKASDLREQSADSTAKKFHEIADFYCEKKCFDEATKFCSGALDVAETGCGCGTNDSLLAILRRLGLSDDAIVLRTSTSTIAVQKKCSSG